MTESDLLKLAANKRVLICGERIIDVYHYVKPLGRPTKDAIVSVEHSYTETFEGGVSAAIGHAKAICKGVKSYVAGQVIEKHRWVEQFHFRKLFECYYVNGSTHSPLPDVSSYDAIIVLDYGHGMVDREFLAWTSGANYLAVNVQTNAGNYGYNLATKYSHADYLCVDESEARLATLNRIGDIKDSLAALRKIAKTVVVTLGKNGAIGASDMGTCSSAAFTNQVTDTIGAGDAFFIASALVAQEADLQQLLRIGNAAAAAKTGIVGHQRAVTKDEILAYLR